MLVKSRVQSQYHITIHCVDDTKEYDIAAFSPKAAASAAADKLWGQKKVKIGATGAEQIIVKNAGGNEYTFDVTSEVVVHHRIRKAKEPKNSIC